MELQVAAGSISSVIFMMGTTTMVIRAWRTKDMQSFSATMLVLNNLGNFIHWIYVLSLPVGPIYVLQAFNTAATLFMLIWWVLYHKKPTTAKRITATMRRIVESQTMPRLADSIDYPHPIR